MTGAGGNTRIRTHDIVLWWTGTKPLSGHFPGPPLSVNFTKIFESSVRVLTAARPPVLRGLIKSSDVQLDYSSVVPPDHGRGFESTYTTRFFAILHVSTSPTFTKFSLFGPTGGVLSHALAQCHLHPKALTSFPLTWRIATDRHPYFLQFLLRPTLPHCSSYVIRFPLL